MFTSKKHTGNIARYNHVMNVSAQLARNSGLRVLVNRKVSTTALKSTNKVMYKEWVFCFELRTGSWQPDTIWDRPTFRYTSFIEQTTKLKINNLRHDVDLRHDDLGRGSHAPAHLESCTSTETSIVAACLDRNFEPKLQEFLLPKRAVILIDNPIPAGELVQAIWFPGAAVWKCIG